MTFLSPSKHSPPLELKVLRYLQPRMNLSNAQKLNYKNLQKGYEGELKLHNILKRQLPPNYLMINDLLLKSERTEFQIDTLIIGKRKIYQLEIKNYEGDYFLEKDSWYSAYSGNEIRNPLHQLKRSELLLKRLMQHTNFNFSIEAYIVFINPEFYLYEAKLNLPIIFPTQINRFIKDLQAIPYKQTSHHKQLAKYFMDRRLYQSTHERLPHYQYNHLKKGITCKVCSHFLTPFNYKKFLCKRCDYEESVDAAVKRSVKEFTILFPLRKVTTSAIHEWCRVIRSEKTIRRILMKFFIPVGKGRYTYYICGK